MLKTRKYDRMAEINQLEFAEELIVMEYMGDESYWNHKFSNRKTFATRKTITR